MEGNPQKKAPPLPDFDSLYNRAADTLKTVASPNAPSDPQKSDGIPDFTSIYTQPKSVKQQQLDAITKINNDSYDRMGVGPGALRGFMDFIPAALNSIVATEPTDALAAVRGAGSALKGQAVAFAEHPVDTSVGLAKGMAEGIVKPFLQYPLELITDKQIGMSDDLTQLGDNKQLTPEERDQRARGIGINVLSWILSLGTESAVQSVLIGQDAIAGRAGIKAIGESIEIAKKTGTLQGERVLGQAGTDVVAGAANDLSLRQLIQLRDNVITPTYIRNAVAGTAAGAVGGFTAGYGEGNTPVERLQAGLSYAMVAMPIGVAMTSIGALIKLGKPVADMPDMIAQQAGHIAKLRQLNLFSDMTPAELLFNMNNLEITQSMAASLALRDIEYTVVGQSKDGTPMQYGRNANIIPAVENPAELMRIISEHNANKDNAPAFGMVHTKKDGTQDFLIGPADVPVPERVFFAKTGFVHGQQVSYGGRDSWVIEKAGVPDSKRSYRMELRDLVTDERVRDVKPSDITRLSSREPGDLALHLGRLVTEEDIYDIAQGFTPGGNTIRIQDIPTDVPAWRKRIDADVFDALGNSLEYKDGHVVYKDKVLEPGLHRLEITNAEHPWYGDKPDAYPSDQKRGAFVYVGGKMESVMGAEGKSTQALVGIPGEVTAVFTYDTQPGFREPRVGTQGFYSHAPAPNRAIATEAIKKAHVEAGITQSNSTTSTGAVRAMQNALNFYGRDRSVAGSLTVATPEVLKTRLIEDFLDHVGATPDGRLLISPDEIIAYAGFKMEHGGEIIGQRGQSPETILGQLPETRLNELRNDGIPRFFTESKKPLTLKESVKLIRDQLSEDAVPTNRSEIDRAISRTEVSFNNLVDSFVTAQGIKPEVTPAVRSFLEAQLGRELLGMDGVRSRLTDRSSVPILESKINSLTKTIDRFEKASELSATDAAKLEEARFTRDAFQARVKQLNEAGPLPFTDEERTVYSRLVNEAQSQRKTDVTDLIQTAQGNGFVVERSEGGIITLRDSETWEAMPNRFAEPDAARDFINATGKAKGIEVDNGGNNVVPPSAVAGSSMLPPEPTPRLYEVPHQFAPNSTVSKMMTYLDTVAPWFTPKRAFMIALDNSFKTKFYDDVYLPLQTAKMKMEAMKKPFLSKLKEVEDLLIGNKVSRDRWQVISQYRESMSPQEIVDNLYKERKLTQAEINYAQKLVDDGIDIQKTFHYRRAVTELNAEYSTQLTELQKQLNQTQDPMALSAINLEIKKLNESHATDVNGAKETFIMDDKHLKAVDMMNEIASQPINEASLHGVTRLARAIQNGETDRAGFAAKHSLTGPEIAAAKKLDALYSGVAKQLGIDERITNYFNHFKAYTDIPDASPARLRAATLRGTLAEMPALASDMIRSGEMNVYELDPVKAAMQYINTGFANRHFNDTWKTSRNSAVEHLQQITKGREAAARVINEYIGGMRGVPSAADELGQLAFDKFLTSMGYEPKPEVKTGIVSTFLAATSGAFLGFRPAQGIRDFAQFSKIYYSRFGASRWKNGLDLAFKRDENGVMMLNKLAEEGTVPGLSPLQFASEAELAAGLAGAPGKAKDAIFTASSAGLTLSGQHNAYAMAHAIAYLDTKELAKSSLLDLSRGKITKEQAYKKLSMNSYDIPVAEGFDQLVKDGKFDQAAEYLAQATGTETAFIFGLQNHPYGWGTTIGKLAGQFGTWAVWTRNYLTRLAGRGTAGERAAAMARFASAEVATGLAGRALGFNMRSWYMIPGIVFLGGPAFDYAQQVEDLAGIRGKQRQDLATRQLTQGPLPIAGKVIPGSAALNDYLQAWQLSQARYGPVPVIGKALGFSVDRTQRSWVDELQGNYPQLGR